MDKYEYQDVMHRIKEIEQEEFSWLDYICDKFNYMVVIRRLGYGKGCCSSRRRKAIYMNI